LSPISTERALGEEIDTPVKIVFGSSLFKEAGPCSGWKGVVVKKRRDL
jgi:hypothetical protein